MKILIISPAWGPLCVGLFTGPVLDSHAAALEGLDADVRYICHTDDPARVHDAVKAKTGRQVMTMSVPPSKGYARFSDANAQALRLAQNGEVVFFLNADIIVSREVFRAVINRIESGKRAVICAGTRTLPKSPPPIGVSASDLHAWTLDNAHPITVSNYHKTGNSRLPYVVYFRNGDAVCMRGFHLHPLAIVMDRDLGFSSTPDWDIASNYTLDEIHVVTRADELALAEISEPGKKLPMGDKPFTADDVIAWTSRRTIGFHWWLFSHRIQLRGDGVFDDEAFVSECLAAKGKREVKLDETTHVHRRVALGC